MATIFARQALLSDGWARDVRLTIRAGHIAGIERDVKPGAGDDVHAAIIPGMPNLHSHAFQRAFAGRAERRGTGDDSFWTWREAMYAAALRMSPEDVEAVAAQLYIEMLEAGFTRVGEFHYLHHAPDGREYGNIAEMSERIAAAAHEAGIGLTLLPVFYAHGGFGPSPTTEGQRRFACDLVRFERLFEGAERAVVGLEGAMLGLAPHSLRAATIDEICRLASMPGACVKHIHIAEQRKEVEECLIHTRFRPVEFLLDHIEPLTGWCLIHATHLTEDETRRIAVSGAVVGLCPITEANLGDGVFRARRYLEAGGAMGIGSDSNVEISLGGELRMLEYGQRLSQHARNAIVGVNQSTGGTLFRKAVEGGNAALGQDDAALARHYPADFITLRPAFPDWDLPQQDALLDALVFAPGNIGIDCVYVRGNRLVEGGRHISRDTVAHKFGRAMRRIWE